jgi:hypothetical protein
MRVRTRRFRSDGQGSPPPYGVARRRRPQHPMLPLGPALIGILVHTEVIGTNIRSAVGCPPTGSALPGIESSGLFVSTGGLPPPARYSVLWPLLTSQGISSPGSPQIRTCCFPARPPPFPPEADPPLAEPPRLNPRLRCVVPLRRIVAGLNRRFLFVGPPVFSSLPPAGQLLFQRWLRVVVLSHNHVMVLLQGTFTPFTTRPCWAYTSPSSATPLPRRGSRATCAK